MTSYILCYDIEQAISGHSWKYKGGSECSSGSCSIGTLSIDGGSDTKYNVNQEYNIDNVHFKITSIPIPMSECTSTYGCYIDIWDASLISGTNIKWILAIIGIIILIFMVSKRGIKI